MVNKKRNSYVVHGLLYNKAMSRIIALSIRWVPAILIMTVIFFFSSIPANVMPDFGLVDIIVKKSGHAIGFGLLALAYNYGLSEFILLRNPARVIIALVLTALYAFGDEFHQSFVPGRQPAITDIMIDLLGSGLALIAGWWISRKK
jgi:VanZ family protein